MAAVLAAIAAAALWQSREFSPFAAIFPRAVGSALLLCSLLSLWRTLRGRAAPAESIDRGGAMRSAMLVLVLLLWVAMLDTAGFALASWVGFFVLTLLANRDPLRPGRVVVFAVGALACVLLLQLLFQRGLDVRLPAGVLLPKLFG
ncbi:MAG: tripartite tricarboxylate transporter TctB family protein [Gammaproteobacteria bacterium]|nr:tripartite tricarboxylate transporter TctB family protein [Gammaproteobacteria bacterium]MBU2287039.1 tripartite tricarboxylate transporter TctB family protein [Gammaproteobacteria bacterium]